MSPHSHNKWLVTYAKLSVDIFAWNDFWGPHTNLGVFDYRIFTKFPPSGGPSGTVIELCSSKFSQAFGLNPQLLWFLTQSWPRYNHIIMSAMPSQITSLTIVYSIISQVQIKENIKAPLHWPLCGEFISDQWIPRTKGQLHGKCFHLLTSSWVFCLVNWLHTAIRPLMVSLVSGWTSCWANSQVVNYLGHHDPHETAL